MDPGEVEVVASSVTDVTVVADPAKGRRRVVLLGLGPVGERVDVVPAAARAGDEVDGETERVLSPSLVAGRGIARGDGDVKARAQERQVGEQSLVDRHSGLTGNRDDPSPAEDAP